ncbi:chloride channel protein [Nocardioides sp.]|uniref:chloride channel protein n=1 Tax=Nocardioides sp. TaxID=35761 RepID=UPI003529AC41
MRTVVLAVVLGAAVGLFAAVYLLAVHGLEHLLWDGTSPRLLGGGPLATVLLCVAGGVLVGAIRVRHDHELPHDIDDALHELDEAVDDDERTPPPSVNHIARSALLGVVSLGFGASLGPEAPLLVVTVGLGQRLARILHATRQEAAYISAAGALSGLFGGPLGSVVLPIEGGRASARKLSMLPFGLIASVSGLFALLLALPGEGGHRYHLATEVVPQERELLVQLLWATLAALPAALAGLALMAAAGPVRRLAERWLRSPVLRAAAGGLVLGLCGAAAPLTLFSGQHQEQQLIDDLADYTAVGLLLLVALKLVATLACLSTGWFGGQIFPAIFAGSTMALVLTAVAATAPVGAVAAAGAAAATAAILRRPLASVLLLLFYFPGDALAALTVGAAVAMLVVHLLGDRAPASQKLVGGH